MVQVEIKKRKATGRNQSGLSPFSSRIICKCGSFYGPKLLHSTSKYRRTVWRCNRKYNGAGSPCGSEKCQAPHLYEADIQKAFVEAFNRLYGDRERLIGDYAEIITMLTDTTALDNEIAVQQSERDVVMELMRKYSNLA